MDEMKRLFGKVGGREVFLYTLANSKGMNVEISPFGAAVYSINVADKDGLYVDVTAGWDDLDGYQNNRCFYGAAVGRYANRIAGGRFMLNGKEYKLAQNDGNNHLHGGPKGYYNVLWDVAQISDDSITLTYHSPDGEEGYPGNLDVSLTYTVTEDNVLTLEYEASGDADTIVNLTNHTYFNLEGHSAGYIGEQIMQIFADRYIPTDDGGIPYGRLDSVSGTPYDFTKPTPIGLHINEENEQLKNGSGYDQCFVVSGEWVGEHHGKPVRLCAQVSAPESGIVMRVESTEDGLQFYSGNHMGGTGKQGTAYAEREAFCLEAGCFPNAANEAAFPSPALKAGQTYRQLTRYAFSVK